MSIREYLPLYFYFGLTLIPLTSVSKLPLVKWLNGWNPIPADLEQWSQQTSRWESHCVTELGAFHFDNTQDYRQFSLTHELLDETPLVKTGKGYHLWLGTKRPVVTQRQLGLESRGRVAVSWLPRQPPLPANLTDSLAPATALSWRSDKHFDAEVGSATVVQEKDASLTSPILGSYTMKIYKRGRSGYGKRHMANQGANDMANARVNGMVIQGRRRHGKGC